MIIYRCLQVLREVRMAENIEARFERYCDVVCRRASPCGSARAGMLVSEGADAARRPQERRADDARVIHRMCARRTSRCITCWPTRNGNLHVREARQGQFPGRPLLIASSRPVPSVRAPRARRPGSSDSELLHRPCELGKMALVHLAAGLGSVLFSTQGLLRMIYGMI
jgi:hypothetical protein